MDVQEGELPNSQKWLPFLAVKSPPLGICEEKADITLPGCPTQAPIPQPVWL